jgi:alpha-tubulin suppressor-like RCC1 family protein
MASKFKSNGTDLDDILANRAWFQKSNTLFSWGYRPIGDNTTISRSSPVQISSLSWKEISEGGGKFAISTAGSLWALGVQNAASSILGLNDILSRSSPVQVGTDTNWQTVSSGLRATGAIRTNGTLWMWGSGINNAALLGLNSIISRSSPTQVGSLTDWSKISVGVDHSLAIKTNGTLWSWGRGFDGALGLNSTVTTSSPTQVGSDTNWSSVSAGGLGWFNVSIPATIALCDSIMLKTNGTLWSIGTGRSSPVQVGTDTNWKSVTQGSAFGSSPSFPGDINAPTLIGVKTTGTLWAFSSGNGVGQLGLNDTVARNRAFILVSSPVQVGTLSNWADVKPSGLNAQASFGLKTDGTLWSWGGGFGGALGLNTTTNRSSPVQVGSLTGWKTITTGPLAIVENNSFI